MAIVKQLTGRLPGMQGVRYRMRATFLGPLIMGMASAYLLAVIPQSREVYLANFLEGQAVQAIIGFLLVGLLCLQLDCWHRMLGIAAIDRAYPEHADVNIDRQLVSWNASFGRLAAALPILGLCAGASIALTDGRRKADNLDLLFKRFNERQGIVVPADTESLLFQVPYQIGAIVIMVIVALAGHYIYAAFRSFHNRRQDPAGFARTCRRIVVLMSVAIAIAAAILPLIPALQPYAISISRDIGPVGATAISLIALVCILMLLSYASSILRLPVLGFAMTLLFGMMAWQTYAALKPHQAAELTRTSHPRKGQLESHNAGLVAKQFDDWLAARPDRAEFSDKGKPYPVILVAAQGGGIYASATALAFLTAMQDDCAGFSQHVFAISAVSGGAVGAAVFNGLVANAQPVTKSGCSASKLEPGRLATAAAGIVEQDHLSPALMQIWPDVVRKLFPGLSPFNRSTALERSFACAFEDQQSPRFICGAANGGDGLRIPFDQHWRPEGNRPALILNATWGETGYRAAFAPFPLHATSDGTLFAFPDAKNPGDFSAKGVGVDAERSLIEAAFVSARFPGIVPAYRLKTNPGNGESQKLWNFVDGGYADNSGSTTALEMYNALKNHVSKKATRSQGQEAAPADVEFYLVLLTDVTTDNNLTTFESGTTMSDTVAPITALLSVRSQLANRAVTRAIEDINQSALREDLAGRTTDISPVLVVNLKQTTFELPLGWKISRLTHDIVRQMLGRPELCRKNSYDDRPPDNVERVINDNSCVKQSLRDLISADVSRTQAK